jgi:orotidine-5'-phosphate decarboxylase
MPRIKKNPWTTFTDRSIKQILIKRSILCVGLDPQLDRIPPHLVAKYRRRYGETFEAVGRLFLAFNRAIVDAVAEYAVWVKPQMAFYECYGHWGVRAFQETVKHAHRRGLIVIGDGKRGDGGDTARAYAEGHVGVVPFFPNEKGEPRFVRSRVRCDALTIHGYIGEDCVGQFVQMIKAHGTCCFVVDKTSFKPNSAVEQLVTVNGRKVWEELALFVGKWGEGTEGQRGWRNLGVVMGATYPEETIRMRELLPNTWFLVPGFGAQGGAAVDAVLGADENGFGITVNSSRDIIFACNNPKGTFRGEGKDFAQCAGRAARDARDRLNQALREAGKGRAFLEA